MIPSVRLRSALGAYRLAQYPVQDRFDRLAEAGVTVVELGLHPLDRAQDHRHVGEPNGDRMLG
jgi:hypothetical protein